MRERPLFMIVASTREGVIGRNGALPWTIPEDTEWFLSCVRGCTVIFGRRCYHENGGTVPGCDDLIVVTRKARLAGARTASSFSRAAELARQTKSARPIWVAGGEALYREALPVSQRLYLTEVHADAAGDTFFPLGEARARFTRTVFACPGVDGDDGPRCIFNVLEPPAAEAGPCDLGPVVPPFS